MAKRRNGRNSGGTSLGTILVIVVLVAIVAFLATRLVNSCSDCEKRFFGLGYEGNVVDQAIDEQEQILCEDCAERHHALSLLTGKELDEYKRVLVPGELVPGEVKFGDKTDK